MRINELSITRGQRIKVQGIELGWEAGDLYVAPAGVTVRDNHVNRVYKATEGGVTPTHTYHVVPGSYEGNTFRVRIYLEPAHAELADGADLNALMGTESLNFTTHVN